MTKKIGISLPDDIHERLERNAREQDIAVSQVIQQALSPVPLAGMPPSIRGRVEAHAQEIGISVEEFTQRALAAFLADYAAHIQARGDAPDAMKILSKQPITEMTMALLTKTLASGYEAADAALRKATDH